MTLARGQYRDFSFGDNVAGNATENNLNQPAMGVGTGDQQICIHLFTLRQDRRAHRFSPKAHTG